MTHRTPRRLCLSVLLLLATASNAWCDGPESTDRLTGSWEVVATEAAGERLASTLGNQYRFEAGRYAFVADGKTYEAGSYTADWGRSPAHLDITPDGKTVRPGIAKFVGDSFVWIQAIGSEAQRPTEFRTRPNSGLMLNELRRAAMNATVPQEPPKLAIVVASPPPDLAKPAAFTIRWLDSSAGESTQSVELNRRGDVLGERGDGTAKRPCLWRDGVYDPLPALDRAGASALGLNDDGVVGATSLLRETQSETHLYRDGRLDRLTYDIQSPMRMVYGLGAGGHVIGVSFNPMQLTSGWVWRDGKVRPLRPLGGWISEPRAVNIEGLVVGLASTHQRAPLHAASWRDGAPTDLGVLPGGESSEAADVNDGGTIVGSSDAAGGARHAVRWRDGRIEDLGVLPGGSRSEAFSINSQGWIGGWSYNAEGYQHGVLWIDDAMLRLNDLVTERDGWSLAIARAVNDRGQLAGTAKKDGRLRAFLLTPTAVTPPAVAALADLDEDQREALRGRILRSIEEAWTAPATSALANELATAKNVARQLRIDAIDWRRRPTLLGGNEASAAAAERSAAKWRAQADEVTDRLQRRLLQVAWERLDSTDKRLAEREFKELATLVRDNGRADEANAAMGPDRATAAWLAKRAQAPPATVRAIESKISAAHDAPAVRAIDSQINALGDHADALELLMRRAFVTTPSSVLSPVPHADDAFASERATAMARDQRATQSIAQNLLDRRDEAILYEAWRLFTADERRWAIDLGYVAAPAPRDERAASTTSESESNVSSPMDSQAGNRNGVVTPPFAQMVVTKASILQSRDGSRLMALAAGQKLGVLQEENGRRYVRVPTAGGGLLWGWIDPDAIAAVDGETAAASSSESVVPTRVPEPTPRPASSNPYPEGALVEIEWRDRWWKGSVVAVEGQDAWKIHYDGYGDNWDETVGPDRIRPRQE